MIDSYFRKEFTQNKGNMFICSSLTSACTTPDKNKSEKNTTEALLRQIWGKALVSIWLQENCTSAYTGRDTVESERDCERQMMWKKSFWRAKEQVCVGKRQELSRSCQHTQQLNTVLHKDSTLKH